MKAWQRVLTGVLLSVLLVCTAAARNGAEIRTLENGITMVMLRDANLPLVSMGFYQPGGVVAQSEDNSLASITYALLSEGTRTYSRQQLHSIEENGGSIGAQSYNRLGALSATVHRDDAATTLSFLVSMQREPLLPPERFEVIRNQTMAAIANRQAIAHRHGAWLFRRELFAGTPMAFTATGDAEATANLSIDEVRDYHRRVIARSGGAYFLLAGDLDQPLIELVVSQLSALPADDETALKAFVHFDTASPLQRWHDAPGQQAHIFLRYGAPGADDPCFPPLQVGTAILGGGMGSRMFSQLREREGLAYSVNASLGTTMVNASIDAYMGTARHNAAYALDAMQRHFHQLRDEQVSESELQRAQNYLVGNHALSRETIGDQGFSALLNIAMGLGAEHDASYPERIFAVTAQQIQQCAQQWLDAEPDFLVYGADQPR